MNGGESWAWADRHEVTRQIEETIMNALHWEDIPLSPDGSGVYVPDDHFDSVPRDESVELYEDPTPRLEAKTDHLLLTTLRDMGETAWDVTQTVATDGGATVDGLAEQLGKHPATIYRAISNLGEIFDLDDGEVSFRVRKYRDELRALIEATDVRPRDVYQGDETGQWFLRIPEGKGEKERQTPMPTALAGMVRVLSQGLEPDDRVLEVTPRTVRRWVGSAAVELAEREDDDRWMYVGPHDLRRTWRHLALEAEVLPSVLMQWGGWDDYETFQRHYLGKHSESNA